MCVVALHSSLLTSSSQPLPSSSSPSTSQPFTAVERQLNDAESTSNKRGGDASGSSIGSKASDIETDISSLSALIHRGAQPNPKPQTPNPNLKSHSAKLAISIFKLQISITLNPKPSITNPCVTSASSAQLVLTAQRVRRCILAAAAAAPHPEIVAVHMLQLQVIYIIAPSPSPILTLHLIPNLSKAQTTNPKHDHLTHGLRRAVERQLQRPLTFAIRLGFTANISSLTPSHPRFTAVQATQFLPSSLKVQSHAQSQTPIQPRKPNPRPKTGMMMRFRAVGWAV